MFFTLYDCWTRFFFKFFFFTKFHYIWLCDLELHIVQDHDNCLISPLKTLIFAEKNVHNSVYTINFHFILSFYFSRANKVVNSNFEAHIKVGALNSVFLISDKLWLPTAPACPANQPLDVRPMSDYTERRSRPYVLRGNFNINVRFT